MTTRVRNEHRITIAAANTGRHDVSRFQEAHGIELTTDPPPQSEQIHDRTF
jgi:hypothetical protein